MTIYRYEVEWQIPGTEPGLSVMHFLHTADNSADRQALAADVRTFFEAVKTLLPTVTQLNYAAELTELDVLSGQPVDWHVLTPPAQTLGTGGPDYAGPAGGRVDWRTSAVRNGRRVTGRTYLVPLIIGTYENNGSLKASTLSTVLAAASAFLTARAASPNPLAVYSRTHQQAFAVNGAQVPDFVTVLRSRRD